MSGIGEEAERRMANMIEVIAPACKGCGYVKKHCRCAADIVPLNYTFEQLLLEMVRCKVEFRVRHAGPHTWVESLDGAVRLGANGQTFSLASMDHPAHEARTISDAIRMFREAGDFVKRFPGFADGR